MKIKKRHKIVILLSLLSMIIIMVYNNVNSGIKDTTKIQAEEAFTTNELLLELQNEHKNLDDFIEKAIEIEGEIKEITFKAGKYSLILKGDSEKTYILCEMQTNQNSNIVKLEAGQNIKLKGILKGFLMDIIILHCVII